MTDKIIDQLKTDYETAQNNNVNIVNSILETVETASTNITTKTDSFTKKLTSVFAKSKKDIDSHAKVYDSSVKRLFQVDGWRKLFFWLGIWSSICTPIVLIIIFIRHVMG